MNELKYRSPERSFLDGHLLLAMPGMTDPRFEKAVIYLCAHSPEGAMGIRINQAQPRLSFFEILTRLGIRPRGGLRFPPAADRITIYDGGPVETGRGFVLHSADYVSERSTVMVGKDVCLTATLDILRAIASGAGPSQALLALGYAGWGPGQLESEIQANGWLNCLATSDLVFDSGLDGKYDRALARIGIDPRMLSGSAGHA